MHAFSLALGQTRSINLKTCPHNCGSVLFTILCLHLVLYVFDICRFLVSTFSERISCGFSFDLISQVIEVEYVVIMCAISVLSL